MTAPLSPVAQQYSSENFASLRFHSSNQKIRLRFKNTYFFFNFLKTAGLKLPTLKMRKPGSENGSALRFPYSLGTVT
jgi:hypothetical protein